MKKTKLYWGLGLFFLTLLVLLTVLLINRDEPLYNTVKERRQAQQNKKLQSDINKEINRALEKNSAE